jgi:hypothetical protein
MDLNKYIPINTNEKVDAIIDELLQRKPPISTSFPQLFYPLMTRQFFCDFHEKSEDFCVS